MRRRYEERQTLATYFDRTWFHRFAHLVPILIVLVAALAIHVAHPAGASAAPATTTPHIQIATQQTDEQAEKLMLDEPVQELPVVNDARWSSRWTSSTPVAVVVWIVLMIVLSVLGRPLARLLFGAFPDAGQGFSRLMILLLAGWIVWFAASWQIIEFRAVWAWYAVIAVAVVAWLLASSRWGVPQFAPSRRAIGGAEAAFWIVFALFLTLRFFNPDSWHPIWGGEKPMEFAHINALLRTPSFPAFDPWFSGGILNYYYYGEYLVAFLIKLTGIPSEIAFNLAQPTMLGLAASAMYSVVVALSNRLSRDRVDPLIAGGLGVLIFCLMGNLTSAWQLILALPNRPEFSFAWTWDASRAVDGGITEFPYFTGLYADLHAHLIALPVTIAVIGLGFALATSKGGIGRDIPKFVLLALCLGTLSAANAWDVPVYAVLVVAAVFLWSARFGSFIVRLVVTAFVSAVVGVLGYGMFRPFHEHFVALFSDVGRVTQGTDLGQFALHFGGLLGILGIAVFTSGLFSWSEVAAPLAGCRDCRVVHRGGCGYRLAGVLAILAGLFIDRVCDGHAGAACGWFARNGHVACQSRCLCRLGCGRSQCDRHGLCRRAWMARAGTWIATGRVWRVDLFLIQGSGDIVLRCHSGRGWLGDRRSGSDLCGG